MVEVWLCSAPLFNGRMWSSIGSLQRKSSPLYKEHAGYTVFPEHLSLLYLVRCMLTYFCDEKPFESDPLILSGEWKWHFVHHLVARPIKCTESVSNTVDIDEYQIDLCTGDLAGKPKFTHVWLISMKIYFLLFVH